MSAAGVQESLRAEARTAEVVIFRSRLTDVRDLRVWLEGRGLGYREVEMPMGSSHDRERFHALQEMTGWQMLPQVFRDGRFLGGEAELRASLSKPQSTSSSSDQAREIGTVIEVLGYGGLIPFLGGALAIWLVGGDAAPSAMLERVFLGYGAVILSFLGAIHWGRVLQPRAPEHPERLAIYGVVPSLVAWVTLALPFPIAAPLQAMLFIGVYGVDRSVMRGTEIPASFLRLRLRLTTVVVVAILLAWLGAIR